jgi:N-carbamoyl-L-amino-acid hydrolase
MDSVPNGGWLDGCLNVLAGLEVLRRISAQHGGRPPVTVRLVDWADEEGARFGKSLFGSSACAGTLDMAEARGLRDREGVSLPDALAKVGIDFERVKESGRELAKAASNCTSSRGPCCSTWAYRWAPSWAPSASRGTRSRSGARRRIREARP